MALLFVAGAAPAAGQEPSSATSTTAPPGAPKQAITGQIDTRDDEPIEGVRIIVRQDDERVGSGRTDKDGNFSVPVPTGGVYQVTLDRDSLPDGVDLRDPDRSTLERVVVRDGRDKRVLFPLGADEGGSRSTGARILNLAITGLKTGAIIALASLGLSLVFSIAGLVNFAHAELVTFGAVVAFMLHGWSGGPGLPLLVAAPVAVVAGGAFGLTQEVALWRPLRRRQTGRIALLVISIGLSLFVRHIILLFFGPSPRTYPDFAVQQAITAGPLSIVPKDLVILVVAIALLVVVGLFLQGTRIGTAMRAVADNRDLAESSGIDVQRVTLITWVAAGALAGLGGILFGVTEAVVWDMGFTLLLLMFAGVILGGLGTAYGAMVGGFVIGVTSEVSTFWLPVEFKLVVALGLLIAVLLVRPQGILGSPERIG